MGLSGFIPSNNPKIIEELNTKYLNTENIVGRSEAIQTDSASYPIGGTFWGTYTDTVTEDFILTSISFYQSTYASASSVHTTDVYIDNDLILTIKTQVKASGEVQNTSQIIPIPNWLIRSNTILKIISNAAPANGAGASGVTFIGYLA